MRGIRSVLAVALLASVLLFAGCSSTSSAPSTSSGSATSAVPSAVTVILRNMAFNPADVTVAVGGTVTFTNNDSVDHTVTGDSFDSGALAPGASFKQTFATAGSFPIHCTIHPSMTGNVTVK
jgi:plastocyanin